MNDDKLSDNDLTIEMNLPPPRSIAGGRYQVLGVLGRGGQKQVFLARDTRLDRDVVISLLRMESRSATRIDRLWREARALAQLGDHPNIVTVFDVGEEGAAPYLVCQYMPGGSVADLLEHSEDKRLPVLRAMEIAQQVCSALEHVHAAGIVHRDLKPSNVWLAQDGTAKLGDFGLALRIDSSQQSIAGTIVGTAWYLSPEQAEGRPAEARSDLYALGVLLYEMLAGRRPFLGDNLAGVIWQHINAAPVAPSWHNPEIPPALETLMLRLLAKSLHERPESARAVREALGSITHSANAMSERTVQRTESLDRVAAGIFVGREREMALLRSVLRDAMHGKGRMVTLAGEPGSGKTQTTERLAAYARLHGACVLIGRCYGEEGAPAFWPWVQMIREYVRSADVNKLAAQMSSGADAIAELAPEINGRLGPFAPPPQLEPAQARFRLFDSITTFFKNTSQFRPLVLIIDDLHWADKPSLLLLEFLARESRSARILIVVAYREMEIGKRHPLLQTLADLARGGLVERLSLGGLTESEVGQFIAMSTGRAAAGGLISSVYARTEGNPFFVSEVVKLLVSEGVLKEDAEVTRSVAQLPQGVRDVIGRRLDRLSPDCNRLLATAAVIGREFNADLLERVSGDNSERVFELLQEAVDARILSESARHPGEYAFGHALIREVLYEALGLNRRVRLHRTVGAAIEKAYEPDIEPHLPELAYHFLQCAPAGDVGKAINYAVRAAERATALLAYEEAAQYYERALEALDLQKSRDEKKRCELLLELGEAHKRAGNNLKARSTFEQAAEVARRAGGPELLARAALGFAVVVIGAVGLIDQLQIRLLTEALDALPNKDSGLRAQVLAHLSAAMYYSPAKREPMSLEAVEMARRVGDPVALVTALYCHHVALMLTEDLQTRRAAALEMLQVAEAAGLREMELRALYRLTVDAMELGDMCALDEAIENYARSAQALKQPAYLWLAPFFRGSRALLKGDFAECERLGKEALGIAQKIQSVAALLFVGVQMSVVRVEQGRAEEQLEATMRNLEQFPMIPGNRAILAYLYAHLDRTEDASRTMREMTANDFAALPRDGSWIVVLSALSYVCWIVRDAQTAEQIYPRLLPYHGRNIVSGNSGVGVGSVWRPLGLLAASMGRWSEAISHFEAAIAMNESMGARPAKAGAQVDLAESLYERNMPGDRSRAAELLDVAAAQAEELGQGAVQERIRRARLQGIGKI